MRGTSSLKGVASLPHSFDGRIDGDPSGADAAAANPCYGDPHQRPRTSTGEMVQSASRVRLPHAGGGDGGHFRAHGDAASLWHCRIAAGPVRLGALRPGSQGLDGRRSPPRGRTTWSGVPLAGVALALVSLAG